jgi:hypothetical protein
MWTTHSVHVIITYAVITQISGCDQAALKQSQYHISVFPPAAEITMTCPESKPHSQPLQHAQQTLSQYPTSNPDLPLFIVAQPMAHQTAPSAHQVNFSQTEKRPPLDSGADRSVSACTKSPGFTECWHDWDCKGQCHKVYVCPGPGWIVLGSTSHTVYLTSTAGKIAQNVSTVASDRTTGPLILQSVRDSVAWFQLSSRDATAGSVVI